MAVDITLQSCLFLCFVFLSNVRVKILQSHVCVHRNILDSMTGTSNFLMKGCQHGSVDVSQSEVGAVNLGFQKAEITCDYQTIGMEDYHG